MQENHQKDLLKQASQDIAEVEPKIKQAEDLISMLEQAGEDVTPHKNKLRELKTRSNRWNQAIKSRISQ